MRPIPSSVLKVTRRDALRSGAAVAGFGIAGCGTNLGLAPDASYDEVLDALHGMDVEIAGELSNHAPMAVEALVALHHPDRVVSWLSGYQSHLLAFAANASPLTEEEKAAALGDFDQRAGWIALYADALEVQEPAALVQQEIAALAPGMLPSLHGMLRAAHALRALGREDTPARRRELAFGLGYWAARSQRLPGTPGAQAQAGLDVRAALRAVPRVPDAARVNQGRIVERLAPLSDLAAFADAVEAVDLSAVTPDAAVTLLTEDAARMFFNAGGRDFVLLHAITGSAALRLLFPALDAPSQRLLVGYAFQAVAGAYAVAAGAGAFAPIGGPPTTVAALRNRALAAQDEHIIKLTEAALREVDAGASTELLTAAFAFAGY